MNKYRECVQIIYLYRYFEINRIYDGVEAETMKSQASFQII